MQKDFQQWHRKKMEVHNERPRVFFKEREIWFFYCGENVGFEQDGRGSEFLRPVLVVKKFNKEISLVIPLTRTEKQGRYYFQFVFKDGMPSTAILSQIRLVDAKRLKYKIGEMEKDDFAQIKAKIRQLFV